MKHIYADDGRILTPPKELIPLLKGAYSAFYNLVGHIRFFYVADEIWDGESSLIFNTDGKMLAAITLGDGTFTAKIEDKLFYFSDGTTLDDVFKALDKIAASYHRPKEQLDVNLDEYPSGIRCDLCQLNKINNVDDFSGNRKFHVMNRHCYFGVSDGWGETEFSTYTCEGNHGCYANTYSCLENKGFKNCLECGDYRTCDHCGVGHNPGECNLGITAEEVTSLIIPYCEIERLDLLRKGE